MDTFKDKKKSSMVIEPVAMVNQLSRNDLLIIDLGNPQRYAQSHILGAVNIPTQWLVSGVNPVPGKLASLHQLEKLFSSLGYTGNNQCIVPYDDEGGGWAGRFIWTLDVIGHSNYSYLNGGMHAWLQENMPVTSLIKAPEPTNVDLTINKDVIASREYIEARIGNPDVVIWDARSPEEFRGERLFSMRGGHIPGAINYEWSRAIDPAKGYRIKKDVEKELDSLGITKCKEIITHCQGHHRSGFTYMLAKTLGYERVRAYDGSWSEWGNLLDTPVEQ
ncbi:MAG: rhodanese-like domain-containing protein [Candidatus Endonucleobacter sp. (ex Gigantidas childressi)]|nr:rhodanese-like domain-containing protein [Candidatus Endonucleobacter sp. (ex Gigantidas childressi)]